MDPLKNIEKENAREWDEVSNTPSLPSPQYPPGLSVPSAVYGGYNNYNSTPKLVANQTSRTPAFGPTYGATPPVTTYGSAPANPASRAPAPGSTSSRPTPQRPTQQRPTPPRQTPPIQMHARTQGPRAPLNRSPQKPLGEREPSNSGASSGSSVNINVARPQGPQGYQHPSHGSQNYLRQQNQTRVQQTRAKEKWGKSPGLVTNRRNDHNQEQALKKELEGQYLKRPDRDEQFPAIGFYLWPSNDEGEHPSDILGAGLEELNAVRVEEKVFLEMNEDNTCIKISCRAAEGSEDRIQKAIKAIRDIIRHSRALRFAAQPTHIAIPPTAGAMMTIVKPTTIFGNKIPYDVTDLVLAGETMSRTDKLVWDNERPERMLACRKKFEEAMIKGLRALAPYRGWMQMRLRFGHVILRNPKNRFRHGKSDWQDFFGMVNSAQMRSRFSPNFDDAAVIGPLIQSILDRPDQYKAADGKYKSLEAVPFQHTEIIFFETSDGPFRAEAEIDRLEETQTGEYQIGAIRLFRDHSRNKRIRVTGVDVEKQIDWDLEVISDNEVREVPPELTAMIKESVTTRTPVGHDCLGLHYPDVKEVNGPGMNVTATVVKSVQQYAVVDLDYIVEIAIYRRWLRGCAEAEVTAGVSMYQKLWDTDHMRSLHGSTETRSWEDLLMTFFGRDFDGEIIDGSKGVERFLAEVETIQGFLRDAVKDAKIFHSQNQNTWEEDAEAAQSPAVQVDEQGMHQQNSSHLFPGDVWTTPAGENGPSSSFYPAGEAQIQPRADEVEDLYSAD